MDLQSIHRRDGDKDIYFVANVSQLEGNVHCSFPSIGKQPELWDPVAGTMSDLSDFEQTGKITKMPLHFAACQKLLYCVSRSDHAQIAKTAKFPESQ